MKNQYPVLVKSSGVVQTTPEKPKPTHMMYSMAYFCETCADRIQMTISEMITHLQEKHGIDTAKVPGTREEVIHLDFDDGFTTTWSMEFHSEPPVVIRIIQSGVKE